MRRFFCVPTIYVLIESEKFKKIGWYERINLRTEHVNPITKVYTTAIKKLWHMQKTNKKQIMCTIIVYNK